MIGKQQRPIELWFMFSCMLFLGLGGIAGGIGLMADPSGKTMDVSSSYLKGLPISDFFVAGLFLFIVMGILPLTSLYALWKQPHWKLLTRYTTWTHEDAAWGLALIVSLLLLGWMTMEISIMGLIASMQYLLIALGLAMLGLVLLPRVRRFYANR